MPLPPSFLSLLDDMSRTDMEGLRDLYATCIFWSTLAVGVGCGMEVPEVLHELWPNLFPLKFDRPIKIGSSTGLLFVVLGVGGELCFEHWRSGYEGLLQSFDNEMILDAGRHIALAQQEAGDAKDSAVKAAGAAKVAQGAADGAATASGAALQKASAARSEVNSLSGEVVSAKALATEANSQLAQALKQVADAQRELTLLKTPRTLAKDSVLAESLRVFRGTKYGFSGVAPNQESTNLLEQVDDLLNEAEWTRVPVQTTAGVRIRGLLVPTSVKSEILVEVYASLPVPRPPPKYMQAARALKLGLAKFISPTQYKLRNSSDVSDVVTGPSPSDPEAVLITIGSKP